jgi:hypothetical protein
MRTAELNGQLTAMRELRVTERVKTKLSLGEIAAQLDRLDKILESGPVGGPLNFNEVASVARNVRDSVNVLRGFLSVTSQGSVD